MREEQSRRVGGGGAAGVAAGSCDTRSLLVRARRKPLIYELDQTSTGEQFVLSTLT